MPKILSGFTPQIILNKLNAKMTHPFMDFRPHENNLTFLGHTMSPLSPVSPLSLGNTCSPRGWNERFRWTWGNLDVTPL